nr:glycine cleavage T C-terminal barrel domain-containing protein [Halobacterium noricense]
MSVDLDTDFLGKDALLKARETGIEEEIAPVTLDESGTVVDAGHPVLVDDEVVAYTCRADYDYSINAGIACAYLPTEYTDVGQSAEIEYGGGRSRRSVRSSPLFDS